MKKIIKKVVVSAIILLALFVGCKTLLDSMGDVSKEYYKDVKSTLPLESKYTQLGPYAVKSEVLRKDEGRAYNFKIWYPDGTETTNKQYPVVIFANGTGVTHLKYEPIMEHLASWGFIAVGNDDESSWDGSSTSMSLNLILALNDERESVFFKKVNVGKIGLSGHSQGGVGVINAATYAKYTKRYTSIFGASTTKHELSDYLGWPYDVSKIDIPYFAVAGTEVSDAGDGVDRKTGIAPLWSLKENFKILPKNTPAVIARRKETWHEQMLYKGDGYMTAWFLYTLSNDSVAKQIFVGGNPELKRNANWQDVEIQNCF